MYKYYFVTERFDNDEIVVDMDRNFFKVLFPPSTVCILYSILSKAIHMGSVPVTTTFSC